MSKNSAEQSRDNIEIELVQNVRIHSPVGHRMHARGFLDAARQQLGQEKHYFLRCTPSAGQSQVPLRGACFALSYYADDASDVGTVRVDGHNFNVFRTLWHTMKHIRDVMPELVTVQIWIDHSRVTTRQTKRYFPLLDLPVEVVDIVLSHATKEPNDISCATFPRSGIMASSGLCSCEYVDFYDTKFRATRCCSCIKVISYTWDATTLVQTFVNHAPVLSELWTRLLPRSLTGQRKWCLTIFISRFKIYALLGKQQVAGGAY